MKQLFIVDIGNGECVTHDGYIQIGVFDHSVEKHIELSNAICGDNPIDWQVTYWMPDPFCIRYKRASFQRTEKMNEGSPRTDNATDSRPRDFPDQATTRLERTL
jgi:hypothetical protein